MNNVKDIESINGVRFYGPESFACYQKIELDENSSWRLTIELLDLSEPNSINFFFGERGSRYQGFACVKDKIFYRLKNGDYIGGVPCVKKSVTNLRVEYDNGEWTFSSGDVTVKDVAKEEVLFNAVGSGFNGQEHEGETVISGVKIVQIRPENLGEELLAHWSFLEGKGCIVFDTSKFQRHAALVNTSWNGVFLQDRQDQKTQETEFWREYAKVIPLKDYSFLQAVIDKPKNEGLFNLINPGLTKINALKGEQLLEGVFEFSRFEKVELPFDLEWDEDPFSNRSWQWQYQQIIFAVDLMAAHRITKDKKFSERLEEILLSWHQKSYVEFPPSSLTWHDHTTALRLRSLIFSWEYLRTCEHTISLNCAKVILNMIETHCIILSDYHFYSKHTNHGFDQSLFLYIASVVFPEFDLSSKWKSIAFYRIIDEISVAFTSEGMHVENSPSYQVGMIQRVQSALMLFESIGDERFSHFSSIVNSGLKSLALLIRPDLKLPLIGDTDNGTNIPKFKGYEKYPNYKVLSTVMNGGDEQDLHLLSPLTVLRESGYAIYRSNRKNNSSTNFSHVIFKCGFLSTYHRHDDDLNVLVHALDEDWLIDGGIYKYDENDRFRKYLRSSASHNVPLLEEEAVSRKIDTKFVSQIIKFDENWVEGESYIHGGVRISRKIEFLDDNHFRLFDSIGVKNKKKTGYTAMFHFPLDKKIEIFNGVISVTSKLGNKMLLEFDQNSDVVFDVFEGCDDECVYGWQSSKFGYLNPIKSVRCRVVFKSESCSSMIDIRLLPCDDCP